MVWEMEWGKEWIEVIGDNFKNISFKLSKEQNEMS